MISCGPHWCARHFGHTCCKWFYLLILVSIMWPPDNCTKSSSTPQNDVNLRLLPYMDIPANRMQTARSFFSAIHLVNLLLGLSENAWQQQLQNTRHQKILPSTFVRLLFLALHLQGWMWRSVNLRCSPDFASFWHKTCTFHQFHCHILTDSPSHHSSFKINRFPP